MEKRFCSVDVIGFPFGSGMMRACVKYSSIRRGREGHLICLKS